MAKRSAADKLIARIDADISQVAAVANYVGSDGSEKLTARIDADLERLKGMRGYVTGRGMEQEAPATKRTRGPNRPKPNLTPRTTDHADESARMSADGK